MNAELLLQEFDRLTEAPDAVSRLRRLLLDLGVSGRLGTHCQEDSPALALLELIREETAADLAVKRVRSRQPSPASRDAKYPFPAPPGWLWTRLIDLCLAVTDGDHQPPPQAPDGVPFLVIGNIRTGCIDFQGCRRVTRQYYEALDDIHRPRRGDLLYSLVGSYGIPVVVRDEPPFCVQRHIGIIRPSVHISVDYLAHVLRSSSVFRQATDIATGIAQKTVPLSGLRNVLIPVPPLAEQHRIVAKVDELMAVCDRLEAAQDEKERQRDRLAVASLQRLSSPQADAAVASSLRGFSRLFHGRSRHVGASRQAILELAIQGRLTTRRRTDLPAREILDGRTLTPTPTDIPWTLPSGWAWTSLRLVGEQFGGGTPSKTTAAFWDGAIPWVSPKDMKVEHIADSRDHVSEAALTGSAVRLIPPGAILMVVRGMILAHSFPVALTQVPLTINQDMKAVLPFTSDMAPILLLALKGLKPRILTLVERSTHGTCRLPTACLFDLPIPVPPLEEQERIVAKVDELMAVCDELERSLEAVEAGRTRALEAVLHGVLKEASASLSAVLGLKG